jgi:hypothetical protein
VTKTNSTNYTASGTQFPLANDPLDTLADEDIYTLQRAVNEHTHDDTRGLAVRRINTSAAPGAAGQVRINGDLFQWWADTSDVILTAASTGLVQTWTAQQRLNEPVLMPDVSTPSAPGASLNLLYFKAGLLYRRSGAAGGETPVGTPPAAPIVAKMFDTDGTAGWAELKQITLGGASHKDWVLAFDPSSTEQADFAFPVPPGYAGTPITFYINWRTSATSGNVAFRVDGLVTTTEPPWSRSPRWPTSRRRGRLIASNSRPCRGRARSRWRTTGSRAGSSGWRRTDRTPSTRRTWTCSA